MRCQPPTIAWNDRGFTFSYGGTSMVVNLAEDASDAMLNALSEMLNAGSVELLSSDGNTLAVLQLSNPAAKAAVGGELMFNPIAEGAALAQGNAEIARILSSNGDEVLSVDVGDEDSNAVIKFPRTQLNQGDPVRLSSFTLVLP